MNTAQRILKNFLSLTFAQVITNFLGIVTVAYLARRLGPGDFGKINFALALVGYFAIISHFGLNTIGTREIARCKEKITEYADNILTLKLCLGILAYVLLIIFVLFINKPSGMKYLILLYGLSIFTGNVLLFDWVFQGMEKMEYIGISYILQGGFHLALILLFVKGSDQLFLIPAILILCQLLSALFLFSIFTTRFKGMHLVFNILFMKNLLRQTLSIGLTGVMAIVILNTGVVMLGFMKPQQIVGYFAAAYKIILILITGTATFYTAIFPAMSYSYGESKEKFNKLVKWSFRTVITAGLPATVGIAFLSKPIINFLYGTRYTNAILPLQILIWYAFLTYINTNYSRILWAVDKQNQVFKIVSLQAFLIIILNVIFIYRLGLLGASIVPVLGEIIAFFFYTKEVRKHLRLNIYRYFPKPFVSSLIMGIILFHFANLNPFLLVLLGAAIFTVFLYISKGLNVEDLRLLFRATK